MCLCKRYDSKHDKLRKQNEYNWIDKHKHVQDTQKMVAQ